MCSKIRVSSATASVLGLTRDKLLIRPTTAYLMTPEKCSGGCSFCSQSKDEDRLSRVVWPLFELNDVVDALSKNKDSFVNICVQTTKSRDYFQKVKKITGKLVSSCSDACNINISIDLFYKIEEIKELLNIGANRISLALDCVSKEYFSDIKSGDFKKKLDFLLKTGRKFPGRISTHIIAGLKETDKEIIDIIDLLLKNNIRCGLFAFTPLPGKKRSLTIKRYRSIQTVFYLMKKRYLNLSDISFDETDSIKHIDKTCLTFLKDGEFFRTSGCNGCNRPFYNEKVSELWYNFPRKPKNKEIEDAIRTIEYLFK